MGAAVFRSSILHTGRPAFQCVTVGALAAGVFALIRSRRALAATALVGIGAAVGTAVAMPDTATDLLRIVARWLVVGSGLVSAAILFDALDRAGHHFGKFLASGPLVAGVYLAASPLSPLGRDLLRDGMTALLYPSLLGALIGHGVGFGLESVEVFLRSRAQPPVAAGGVPGPAGRSPSSDRRNDKEPS